MCTTGINDTGGKFATGVNDTSSKIAAGVTGGKFCHWYRWCCYTGGNTLSSEYLRDFSKKFELPLWYTQGLGRNRFMKKRKVENLVALSL
jgi:hypothetical protein